MGQLIVQKAMAVRLGVKLAIRENVHCCIIEVDSQKVFAALKHPRVDLSSFGGVIHDILMNCADF